MEEIKICSALLDLIYTDGQVTNKTVILNKDNIENITEHFTSCVTCQEIAKEYKKMFHKHLLTIIQKGIF